MLANAAKTAEQHLKEVRKRWKLGPGTSWRGVAWFEAIKNLSLYTEVFAPTALSIIYPLYV